MESGAERLRFCVGDRGNFAGEETVKTRNGRKRSRVCIRFDIYFPPGL